jgi:hypothetical protein
MIPISLPCKLFLKLALWFILLECPPAFSKSILPFLHASKIKRFRWNFLMQLVDIAVSEMLCHSINLVEINDALRTDIMEPIVKKLQESGELQSMIEKAENRDVDPYSAAEEIAKCFIK